MIKKGFTLIELLAIIVILAVIAIITTPILLNVVENSKRASAESSAVGYLEALEDKLVIEEILNGKSLEKKQIYLVDSDEEYDYSELEYFKKHPDFNTEASKIYLNSIINIKGKKPTVGYVIIGEEEIEEAELVINGYVVYCDSNRRCMSTGKFVSNSNVTNVEIEKLESYIITEGSTITLKAQAVTIDGTEAKITWSSLDEELAIVDKNGVVKGLKVGTVTILASAGNKKSRVTITIVNDSILGYLEDKSLQNNSIIEMNVSGETYKAHVYVYDGDTIFDSSKQFGDANDVATASTDAPNMVVVKVNGNLTINSGVKIEPYYNEYGGPKGFVLYVTETLTNNGTIDNSHGAKAVGQNVYLWKNADGTYEYVPAIGGAGGSAIKQNDWPKPRNGIDGISGSSRKTGGGGSGASNNSNVLSGAGSEGTSYSGGTGGGAVHYGNGKPNSATSNGGSGGNADKLDGVYIGGGGAGNPGGFGYNKGSNGTGGLLIIYANNYINNGTISANGSIGGKGKVINDYQSNGGSSGGGSINIFTNQSTEIDQLGIITNTKYSEIKGITNVFGGSVVGTSTDYVGTGGAGGNGTINIGEIRNNQYYDLKEIIEQDKQTYIESVTIEGDSILSILENKDLKSGYYFFVVNGVNYPVHLYTFDEDTIFDSSRKFGDTNDVATSSTYASNMVIVKVNGDLTINSGVKIEPYYNVYGGPKGFTLYVTGTLTNNGTIDNSHGAKAVGQDVYLWKNVDGTYEYVPAIGGIKKAGTAKATGSPGTAGVGRQTGGGGSGSGYYTPYSGGTGTSYSGGTGGGGRRYNYTAGTTGSANGGAGGNSDKVDGTYASGGGAGNPGGSGYNKGSNGTGGLLIIYANDYINKGTVSANGSVGGIGKNVNSYYGNGGSSGGGSINIFYISTLTKGKTSVIGGKSIGPSSQYKGGAGGTGTVTYTKI